MRVTSTCSSGSGIPTDRMTFWGRGFLQRDHRNTSMTMLSQSFFSPFAGCGWWFWDFSVSTSCIWDAGIALTIFSPVKQSSYLQIIFKYKKKKNIREKPRSHHMDFNLQYLKIPEIMCLQYHKEYLGNQQN